MPPWRRDSPGCANVEGGVPQNVREVAVGISEVSRVDTPPPVMSSVGDRCSGCFGPRDDLIDLGAAGDCVPMLNSPDFSGASGTRASLAIHPSERGYTDRMSPPLS
jgi:hypothetical protein